MSTLLEQVVAFLERDDWSPTVEDTYVGCGFRGDNGQWACYITVFEDDQRLVFYSVLPERVPEGRRRDVGEFFLRLNFPLLVGSFDLDLDDGEARFRTSLDIEGGDLTDGLLRGIAYANVTTTDACLPAFRSVCEGTATPADAAEAVG